MSDKHLTEPLWKTLVSKYGLKDIGLQKALAAYARIDGAKEPAMALKSLEEISELALKLKKTCAAKADVVDHLNEMVKEVKKAVTGLEGRIKPNTKDKSKQEEETAEDESDEEAEIAKFKKDLKQQMLSAMSQVKIRAPGSPEQQKEPKPQLNFMAYLAAKACAVIVSRKVGGATKKLLTEIADDASGGKFHSGECIFEKNAHTFVLEIVPSGLAKKLAAALFSETGQKYKVRVRSTDGKTVLDADTDQDSDAAAAAPDPAAAFKQRLESLFPKVKDAIAAAKPGADQLKGKIADAAELAKQKKFAAANLGLDDVENSLNGNATTATGSSNAVRAEPMPANFQPPAAGVNIDLGRPRSNSVIVPAAPALESKDFVASTGKKLTITKSSGGRVLFTAPPPPVGEITFSGGGAKGSALPGAVKALQESGVLKDAKKIAGASVGSMTAALVAAGATAEEFSAIGNADSTTARIVEGTGGSKLGLLFAAVKNRVLTGSGNPLTGMGLENLVRDVLGQTFRARILEYIQQCGKDGKAPDDTVVNIAKRLNSGKTGPTFMDYRQVSRVIPAVKEIVISGTYTTEFTTDGKGNKTALKDSNQEGQLYVFDADSEPDLEVAVAVHASASFPAAFKPVDITLSSGLTVRFIDGGVMNNTPTSSSIGNERQLDPVPTRRSMTFVFEDSDGVSGGLLKGKVTPAQGYAARLIDWFVHSNNSGAEYAKNRDMADHPGDIVVVPLKIDLPPIKKGGKTEHIDMRSGTLNFGLSNNAKLALQSATEKATKEQVNRENNPKTQEFASDSQMFVSIGLADLQTLKDNGYKGAGEAYAFREQIAAVIGKLRAAVKTALDKPGGRAADLLKDKNAKALLAQLDTLAGGNADFQDYIARELNKQTDLDTLLEAIRKGGVKSATLDATFTVSEALRAHTFADNILKQIIYPQMKYESKGGPAIEVLLTAERLLRVAKSADEVNGALLSTIQYFKGRSQKFAEQLERRLMKKLA
jgi:predicted acylesterase/phospholipase RssA